MRSPDRNTVKLMGEKINYMLEIKIIDVWMQHPTKRFFNHPMFESLRKWTKSDSNDMAPPLELTIKSMDAANISKGLICSWISPEGELISNKEVADCIAQYPDRFIGIASVKLNRPVQALEELRYCISEFGFKGLRIIQWLWNLPPTHAYYKA